MKDLHRWGRDKAKERYADGGSVDPRVMKAAKARLADKMRTEPMPDNTKSIRMPDQVDPQKVQERYYDLGTKGVKDI